MTGCAELNSTINDITDDKLVLQTHKNAIKADVINTYLENSCHHINTVKHKLDKLWANENVKFNWRSEVTGSRSHS